MHLLARAAITLAAALALVACNEAAQRPATGGAAAAVSPFDGSYAGTGRIVSGTGCPAEVNSSFPVAMTVSGGVARMPLRSGALAGPVASDGTLDRMRWEGNASVIGETRGLIGGDGFTLEFIYDLPSAGTSRCLIRYEGRRQA